MKKIFAFLLFICAAVFTSCHSDVQFPGSDNLPKIAEQMMGMTPQEALLYMQKEGFAYEGDELHAMHPDEYIFSRGAENGQFSLAAPVVIWAEYVWSDTVNGVIAEQRAESKKNARDLYWKWSHYTESVFASSLSEWYASIWINSESDYTDREQFWADYENASDSLLIVYEYYWERDVPKDISMGLNFEEPGVYALHYITHAYNSLIPMQCVPFYPPVLARFHKSTR